MKVFQKQNSTQTVREALAEYRQDIPGYFDEKELSPESARFFHSHDICHVVFGCDTSEMNEGMVDTWTMFGSDVGIRNYIRYLNLPEIKNLMKNYSVLALVSMFLKTLPRMIKVWRATKFMNRRWPFHANADCLDKKLSDIRHEYNIKVVH